MVIKPRRKSGLAVLVPRPASAGRQIRSGSARAAFDGSIPKPAILLSAILRPSSPFSLLDGALQTGRSVSKRTRLPGSLVRHCSAPLASGSAGGHTVAKAALERWRHRSGTAPPSADHRLLLQEALGAVWVQRLGTSHRNAFLVAKVQFVMYGSGTARGGPPSAPCTSALSLPARGGFASSTCQRAPGPISFGFPG